MSPASFRQARPLVHHHLGHADRSVRYLRHVRPVGSHAVDMTAGLEMISIENRGKRRGSGADDVRLAQSLRARGHFDRCAHEACLLAGKVRCILRASAKHEHHFERPDSADRLQLRACLYAGTEYGCYPGIGSRQKVRSQARAGSRPQGRNALAVHQGQRLPGGGVGHQYQGMDEGESAIAVAGIHDHHLEAQSRAFGGVCGHEEGPRLMFRDLDA